MPDGFRFPDHFWEFYDILVEEYAVLTTEEFDDMDYNCNTILQGPQAELEKLKPFIFSARYDDRLLRNSYLQGAALVKDYIAFHSGLLQTGLLSDVTPRATTGSGGGRWRQEPPNPVQDVLGFISKFQF